MSLTIVCQCGYVREMKTRQYKDTLVERTKKGTIESFSIYAITVIRPKTMEIVSVQSSFAAHFSVIRVTLSFFCLTFLFPHNVPFPATPNHVLQTFIATPFRHASNESR